MLGSTMGCSSGTSDDAAPIARADYCSKLAKDACTRLVTCCNGAGISTDDATCTAREESACEGQATLAETHGFAYDAQAAGTCLAGSRLFHDGCAAKQPGYWESRKAVEACGQVFHGTAKLGDACKLDGDCTPSNDSIVACRRDDPTRPEGKCIAIPRANRGEKCNLQSESAGAFVGCKLDSICVAARSTTGELEDTRCRAPATIGMFCIAGDARMCADGHTCDPTRSVCDTPRALGEVCGALPCAAPYVCQYTSNRCVERIAVGQSCRASDFCVDGAQCVGGECRTLKAEGEACFTSDECQARYCQLGGAYGSGGTCAKVYGGSTGGVDTSECRAVQVK